ncbi:MAG: putative b-glycosyltransferase, Glycosyltransferase Family 2 [Polaromonas sp.]|nr:putative b-glycosyltransferase, Glycosyltransferase Family 2 [Polaromonas sp.]
MRLSVILPCFNGAETIAVQLDALIHQHWPGGWEVIVVNNGSTDNSMAIVERYRDRLPGLKIVQAFTPGMPRLGVPHSYNMGIKAASGDAFVFCEADDEVAPGWLSAMGEALAEHPFVNGRLDHRKLNPAWLHPVDGEGYQSEGIFRITCPPHLLTATGCAFGLQRSMYEKLGPLSVDFPIVHDAEYCFRAQLAGYALHFEPRALIHYREKSDYRARFYQGRNWGRDFTRLLHHYGLPTPRLARTRQVLTLGRVLPSGLAAGLVRMTGRPHGQKMLAEWFWNVGWFKGVLAAHTEIAQQQRNKPLLTQQEDAGAPTESGVAL